MVHYPKVSIVIPVYNYEQYIRECIDSCLSQTYSNIEIIVVDDGSTDGTPAIIESYGSKVISMKQKNLGAAVALNNGIKASSGELVCWLSSDDAFLPNKIELQVNQLQLLPDYDLIYTDFYVIDSKGVTISEFESAWHPPSRALSQVLIANYINGSTVMMRRKVWEAVDGFYERIPANVDTHMWIKLLLINAKFLLLPEKLVRYRTHPGNQSHNQKLMQTYCDLVFMWGFKTIPIKKIHAGMRPNSALFSKGFGHFRAKRICSFLACYKRMDTFSVAKFVATPLYIYSHLFNFKYIRYINGKYKESFL